MSDNIRWKFSFLNSLLNGARMTFNEMLLLARWSKFWTVTRWIFHRWSKTTIVFLPSRIDVSLKAKATTRRKNPFCSRAIKQKKPGRDLRKFPSTSYSFSSPVKTTWPRETKGSGDENASSFHRLKKRFWGDRSVRLSEINEGQIFAPCEAISFVLVTSTPQSLFEPPYKGKGANEPKAHTAGAYTDVRSTKHA